MYSFTLYCFTINFLYRFEERIVYTEPSFPAECRNRLPSDEIIATDGAI